MKNGSLFLFLFLSLAGTAIAQVPQGIPYQAVARNAQGQPLASRAVKVRFSVLDSTATGTAVYVESHSATTSALGLFTTNVGMGSASSGTFSSINWGQNYKFLKVELDTTATGNSYIDLGTQQMMSVPYALYSGSSGSNGQTSNIINTISMMSSPSPLISNDPIGINGYTFVKAVNYCYNLVENGYSDWRLPTYNELMKFIELNGFQNMENVWTTTFDYAGHIVYIKNAPSDYSSFMVYADHVIVTGSGGINCFR